VALAAFNGTDPNGTWSLYVADDSTGDAGSIVSGWSLNLATLNTVNPVADLAVSMTNNATVPLYVGSGFQYSLGVVNNGPAATTNVTVTNTLPAGLTFLSATTSQGTSTHSGGVVTFNLGALAAAGSASLTISVVPSVGGSLVNTAKVSGPDTDLNSANNTATSTAVVRVPAPAVFSELVYTNGQFRFTLTGEPNLTYAILGSTNLTTWAEVTRGTASSAGIVKFADPAAGLQLRFYRAERVIP
jgi:uncharacterized repeat protein (TIGR01451 family)